MSIGRHQLLISMICLLLLIGISGGKAFAADTKSGALKTETKIEIQVREIAGQLRCPVCQGESVYDSNSPVATQMKELIAEKLRNGESHAAIMSYFVDRYGNFMLMEPPAAGIHWLIWILPALFAAIGAVVLFYSIRKSQNESLGAAKNETPGNSNPIEELEL